MEKYETIVPDNSIGKTINILGEVCTSWGFTVSKKAIGDIANAISKEVYEVNFSVLPVHGISGIIRLTLMKDDGTKIVIFSSSEKDQGEGVIHGLNINSKEKEIIQRIKQILGENEGIKSKQLLGYETKINTEN